MEPLSELREYIEQFSTAPTLAQMPRKTLADKGINGPTAAHFIEEIHTPHNLAYLTTTTGTSAFQNIVGVLPQELDDRTTATRNAFELVDVRPGDHLLFAYPPLVNVFSKQALDACGVSWSFLQVSSRDALLLALCECKPRAVVGESSFLRACLEDSGRMGMQGLLPQGVDLIAAGTPLDMELPDTAARLLGGKAHDLYGCQEFGWLTLDGIPLREDLSLLPTDIDDMFDLVVGGLATGDRFPVTETGHLCDPRGKIITYGRVRSSEELVTTVTATTAAGRDTIDRLARGILRVKAKLVRVSPDVTLGAAHTVLSVAPYACMKGGTVLDSPAATRMFDQLLKAQLEYQSLSKIDPTWVKKR